MAILSKRTSSKTLPAAKGLQRSPLGSIIQGLGKTPSISGGSGSSITSGGGTGGSNTSVSRPPITSTTTGSTTGATTPTKTTSPNVTTRPTVTTAPKTSSSGTGKLVNALTGAAIGAGSKLLMDKLTSKPAISTPSRPVTKPSIPSLPSGGGKAPAPKPVVPAVKPPVNIPPNLTDKEVQDELDRAKAAEEAIGPPSGAVDNGDGTYSVVDGGFKTTYDASGSVIGMEAAEPTITAEESLGNGEELVAGDQYFQDDDGNIYTKTAGGSYELYSAAGDNSAAEEEWELGDTTDSGGEFFQDDDGNIYTMSDGGSYELYSTADGETNFPQEPEEEWQLGDDNYFEEDSTEYAGDSYNYDDYYDYAKSGGLITMMKNGGNVRNFAGGGYSDTEEEVQDWQDLFSEAGPQVVVYGPDGTPYGTPRQAERAGVYNYTFTEPVPRAAEAVFPTSGNQPGSIESASGSSWPTGFYPNYDGTATQVFDDGSTITVDADMNPVYTSEATEITSAGGGERPWYEDLGNVLTTGATGAKGLGNDLLGSISGALGTTAGAAGAGALLATLLGSDFSGGGGGQNLGVDMSKMGVINPRTTDFGIGPTRFAGYEDYGTSGGDYTPNEELLRNLNAPGFNPVNEGDYGYEEAPTETPKMASGGLSSISSPVASYYTFGQPADILANLGMRPQPPMNAPEDMPQIGQQQPPQQAQQQGLPQQSPPQPFQQQPPQMPQQGMMPQQQGLPPPMRKGGLPHVSNVPSVQGRMDFRQGSAVHGEGDGQSDDIPAMLADGEYVIDADTVAQIGNGSTKAGAQALDKFRENIRAQKRSAPINKIPPKTKALTSYLKG